ncbi:MAG TPA: type VI secretion system contractile sheath large subunit, partial [Candidatus Binataceae bacterium]|nr:type VI secretion system contractile sheath large subunit [Candidatus Binataceae bacterium]
MAPAGGSIEGAMPRISDSRFSEVHLETEAAPDAVQLDADRPFRILLVGDFSGRSWRAGASRWFEPLGIDRDNFDEVLEGMNVRLDLHGIDLSFRELEDFHPDRIYQSAAIFRRLDELVDGGKPAAAATQSVTQAATQAAPAAGLLDQILAEHQEGRPVSARDADDLASFIQRATEGYVVPRADPTEQQREVRRQEVAAGLLRGILHHPHMQAIESAWRALFMLVRELETDGGLKLYALDISLPELVRDMSAVHEELGKRGPWAVIAGNYSFGQSERDVRVLRRLADMARSLGAPFLGEGWL